MSGNRRLSKDQEACFYTSPFNAIDKRDAPLEDFGDQISFAIIFSPNASCESIGTPPVCAVAVWK
jgi:hypothetical protein